MVPRVRWDFEVDRKGRARVAADTTGVVVQTIEPGEYLVTLPMAVAEEFGVSAEVGDDAGFIAAAPGDERGNKPNQLRILTMNGETFAPRSFTLVVTTSH